MKYVLTIHAYDCLDHVNYTARVREYGDYEESGSELVVDIVGTFRGEGEDDAREWLRDVVRALAERV